MREEISPPAPRPCGALDRFYTLNGAFVIDLFGVTNRLAGSFDRGKFNSRVSLHLASSFSLRWQFTFNRFPHRSHTRSTVVAIVVRKLPQMLGNPPKAIFIVCISEKDNRRQLFISRRLCYRLCCFSLVFLFSPLHFRLARLGFAVYAKPCTHKHTF